MASNTLHPHAAFAVAPLDVLIKTGLLTAYMWAPYARMHAEAWAPKA